MHIYLSLEPDHLASGRPLAFGDQVELTNEDVKSNRRLIDAGSLVVHDEPKTKNAKPRNGGSN